MHTKENQEIYVKQENKNSQRKSIIRKIIIYKETSANILE